MKNQNRRYQKAHFRSVLRIGKNAGIIVLQDLPNNFLENDTTTTEYFLKFLFFISKYNPSG